MDILQQSLQAADILSGEDNDDLFGELGLTFNNPSTETVGLPSELEALATQGDALYSNENGTSSKVTFEEFDTTNDALEMSSFDTSQFLNTSAPVNAATTSRMLQPAQQTMPYVSQSNLGQQTDMNSVDGSKQQSYRGNTPSEQYNAQFTNALSYNTQYQSGPQVQTLSAVAAESSVPIVLQSASVLPGGGSGTVTTVAQSLTSASCSSVFSKAPTQSLTSTVLKSASRSVNMNQHALTGAIQLSTPIQVVQSRNAAPQQGSRQVVNLMQKPTVLQVAPTANQVQNNTQVINGITVQPQAQNQNLAVVKIAGVNRTLNLSDPKVFKALTANILQKQQAEAQNQQVVKLGQNHQVLNMVAQGSQQSAMMRSGQQIALPNGQTILLNNGQQVHICTTQAQSSQVQVVQPSSVAQTAAVRTNQQPVPAGLSQPSRNGQLAFKGIQIASVNIPIVSSSSISSTGNVSSVHGNVVAIPVVGQTGSTSFNAVPAAASPSPVPSTSSIQMPNSSTVRSLLANAILRQNNIAVTSSNHSSPTAQAVPAVNAQQPVATTQVQAPTMLRLNLTPQQLSQLTPAQVQAILKQHQLVQARSAANSNSNLNTQRANSMVQGTSEKLMQASPSTVTPVLKTQVSTTTVSSTTKQLNTEQSTTQVYKVDPTLTESQIDEVKRLLANRTIASKLHCLTKEQQQLVLAFQAQIKTMSPPVQQYYLRNPQLFMHKVLQQVRAGRPFILQVKVDQQLKPRVLSTVNVQKQQHPTISLTQDPNRVNNRVNTPSPVTVQNVSTQQKNPSLPIQRPSVPPSVKPAVTVHVPKQAVKRPLPPEHPAKVSLVLEQLDCHKRMVSNPDCIHPFKSVRDAIRRLVPFHTCNIPNVKEDDFVKAESLFDLIADRISAKTRAMMNKYHLLCFRDSTRDSCSAEMVMIERMFLQKEKVKFAEDKARLRDNPSLIKEYFPRRVSKDSLQSDDGDASRPAVEAPSASSAYDQSMESPLSNDELSAISRVSDGSSDFKTDERGRYSSLDSSGGAVNAKKFKRSSADDSFESEPRDMLLQEAVDSILI